MNSVTANSYQIREAEEGRGKTEVIGPNDENEEDKIIGMLLSLVSIKQIGIVSATTSFFNSSYLTTNYAAGENSLVDINWNCCPETNDGAICQDVSSKVAKDYCNNPIQTKCENTAECKIGCCYDESEGLCSTKSTKNSCVENGGLFAEEENCLIEECKKGCCVIGPNVAFTTERRCEVLSIMNGYEKNFKNSLNELACIAIETIQQKGACVFAGNSCLFTTDYDCATKDGEFKSGKLCSSPEINSSCVKQTSVSCVDGEEEIYWFDSCGNQENIYSSDKETSWNNGNILSKEKSCNPTSNNIDSTTCGNCAYYSGSICSSTSSSPKILDGNYVCKEIRCIDENGKIRQNGESWCVYDGAIGNGSDVVGSRHWKRICNNGVVEVEPCADYRGQICVQSEMKSDTKTITNAQCVINEALNCIQYNQEENMKELCDENKDCVIKNIDIDDGFKFDMCVSQYPKGFDLSYESGKESAEALCGMANQECVVMYEKKITGWECIFNCHCEDAQFTEKMNGLCISMGDCGGYVNIEGKGTDSYKLEENDNKISWKDYTNYIEPIKGKYIEPKDLQTSLSHLSGNVEQFDNSTSGTEELADLNTAITYASTISGAIGTIIFGLAGQGILSFVGTSLGTAGTLVGSATTTFYAPTALGVSLPVEISSPTSGLIGSGGSVGTTATTSIGSILGGTLQVLGSVGFAMGVAAVSAMIVNWAFGLSGDAALVTTLVGAGAGLITGLAFSLFSSSLSGCIASGLFAAICAAIVIIVVVITALILKLLGIGDTKEVHVKYTCMPWQAPFGGEDCSKCNEDPLKPCSEYRCESLGQACSLVNEDSENPECIAREADDGLPPTIELKEVSSGYNFTKQSNNKYKITGEEGSCIKEFTTVLFRLETSERAQCKLDIEKKFGYENMSSFLLEENMFTINHTGGYMMPSLGSLEIYNLTGDIKEKFANSDIYIRCIDEYGNYNLDELILDFCLTDGPDLTTPKILKAEPVNNAYLKKGVTEIPLTIYLNEPAECRIDTIDKDYEIMNGEMDCNKEVMQMTNYGWPCNVTITDLTKSKNTLYIKCKDQPWLEGNENSSENKTRNVNAEGTEYNIYSSEYDLKINSISPTGKSSFGFAPVSTDLIVETSEGFDGSGNAICRYSFEGFDKMYQFFDTGTSTHKQNFNSLMGGEYKIYVSCKDDAGNVANTTTNFNIEIDNLPPQIIRIYGESENINLITDENAVCYYGLNGCEFNLENATQIDSDFTTEHNFNSNEEIKYYIKCKDKWNNINPYCATIISQTTEI